MNTTIVVYSAVFGGYDIVSEPRIDCKHVLYCDKDIRVPGWEIRKTDVTEISNQRMARKIKILGHKYIDTDISIWIDGNITLLVNKNTLALLVSSDKHIALFKHPYRSCAYAEAEVCKHDKRVSPTQKHVVDIDREVEFLHGCSYPQNNGLYETNCVVRNHKNPINNVFNESWWRFIDTYSVRDQISIPYVCYSLGIEPVIIPGNARNSDWFIYRQHK